MSVNVTGLHGSEIRKALSGGLMVRHAILAAAVVISLLAFYLVSATVPNLAFTVVIFMAMVVIFYLASLATFALKGSLALPLVEGSYVLAPTISVGILCAMPPSMFPPAIGRLALPVVVLGTLLSLEPLAKAGRSPLGLILRGLAIAAAGMVGRTMLEMLNEGALGDMLFYSLLAVGLLSFLSLLHDHNRLGPVGEVFLRNRNVVLLLVAALIFSIYVANFRPGLMASHPNLYATIEWAVVGIIALALAWLAWRRLRTPGTAAESPALNLGQLVRDSTPTSDEMAEATEAVAAFLERGEKGRVIVVLMSALKANGMSGPEIAKAIDGLVRYREEDVRLVWAWTYGDIAAGRKKARYELLSRTLDVASQRVREADKGAYGPAVQRSP